MSDKNLIMTLAKVIIAAAWADGEITLEEINSLKDLLFWVPHAGYKQGLQITGQDWAVLEMYIQAPVGDEERAQLVEELLLALRSQRDRELALTALDELVQADGVVTEEETAVLEEIRAAIDVGGPGVISQIAQLIRGPIQRRTLKVAQAPNREQYLDDFIKNRVYYVVQQRLNLSEDPLDIPDDELRKLSLAGGLMARIAHVDKDVTRDELDTMAKALRKSWDITPEGAALVAEVAISEVASDLDYFRLTREFFSSTTENERVGFLDVLFTIASADGQISYYETEEIRRIALSLNLTHEQFIDAKLKAQGNGS